jgi:hypothetical protein
LEWETLLPKITRLPPYKPRLALFNGFGCVENDILCKNDVFCKHDDNDDDDDDDNDGKKEERSVAREDLANAASTFLTHRSILFFITE